MTSGQTQAISIESWRPSKNSSTTTFSVDYGEAVALTGPNGSGKSTILRAIAGIHTGASGTVRVDGVPQTPVSITGSIGAQIDQIPLHRWLTVRENLELACRSTSHSRTEEIETALERFGAVEFATKRVRALSQGMTRRAELAVASLNQPRIVLLDEPADSLDEAGVELLQSWVTRLLGDRCAVLISSHTGPERSWCAREVHPGAT